MIAAAPCQYGWRATTTNPLSKTNAPLTQGHNGFARKVRQQCRHIRGRVRPPCR